MSNLIMSCGGPSCSMQTDRLTDRTKLVVVLRSFSKAPKTNDFQLNARYFINGQLLYFKPQWLRCCTTNRKVAGLMPAGVIGIFH